MPLLFSGFTRGGGGSLSSTGPAARAARGSVVKSSAVEPVSITVRRVASTVPGVFGSALHSCSSITCSMFAKPVKDVAGRHPAYDQMPSRSSDTSGLRPGVVRKIDDNGRCGASHDNPSKRLLVRRIDFHVRQESGDVNEIARLCTRDRFSSFAPANFTDTRENVRDRLLFPVMMNACPGPWFHLEQPAPDGRRDTEGRRDRGTTLGTWR